VDGLTFVPSGAGEVIGDSPERRVEVLCEVDAVHATWSRFGPRRDGADLHVHRRHNDLFYVLAGELTVRLGPGGDGVPAPAGTLVVVPPLVVHGYRNASDAEVRFLNVHAPGEGFAAYLRALRDGGAHTFDQHAPPPDGGESPTAVTAASMGEPLTDRAGVRVTALGDVPEIRVEEVEIEPGATARDPGRSVGALYVLEGELTLTAGERRLALEAGTWLTAPAGVARAYGASGAGRVRLLRVHAPRPGVR
jgi:quercetin dioxygenase-like cupin family protein